MTGEDDNRNAMKRRSVLHALGTTTALATGVTGMTTAEETRSDTSKQYKDQQTREQVFRKHAEELLSELSQRELIGSASLAELETGTFHEEKTRMDAQETIDGVAVTSYSTQSGKSTPLVMLAKNTRTHTIRIYVKPELQESYALVRAKKDGDEFAIDPSKKETKLKATATCDDFYLCGDECPRSCFAGGTRVWKTEYYSCYEEVPDQCSCYIEGTHCGKEDCWEMCSSSQ